MKNQINIGTASIALIFIVLCLSVFALLGLSDAKSAGQFAGRRADAVTSYYETDILGQRFIQAYALAAADGETTVQAMEQAMAVLPKDASLTIDDVQNLVCDIPMTEGQSLHIELNPADASVLSYHIYNSEIYAIDDRMPVWSGGQN